MDLYAENILDHFRHPRNQKPLISSSFLAPPSPTGRGGKPARPNEVGRSGGGDEGIVEHEEWNHACGDSIHLSLLLQDGKIEEVGWTGTGCAISQASMSMLSDAIKGKSEKEILSFGKKEIYALLGVPIGPRRFKCALMSLHTVKNALLKAAGKSPQGWLETVSLGEEI